MTQKIPHKKSRETIPLNYHHRHIEITFLLKTSETKKFASSRAMFLFLHILIGIHAGLIYVHNNMGSFG
jgi:hypothetical protein